MKVLLTGGLGYIGSHTAVELIKKGHEIFIIDNLENAKIETLAKLAKIVNQKINFEKVDMRNKDELEKVFSKNKFDAVIHFAGYKAVGESEKLPLKYYENNLMSTIYLLEIMEKYNVNKLVFSSSACVYSSKNSSPITEDGELCPSNPYGRTKLFIENIIKDYSKSNPNFNAILLRYFNPIGAHDTGLIGEDPEGIPNNLMPYITRVAVGKLPILNIFGNNYETPDGTGVRDYIHIMDLAEGHVLALNKLMENCGLKIYNLGTGKGYSVLEIVTTFNKVNGDKVKYQIAPRRPGDIAQCYASTEKAKKELGFVAKRNLEDMCKSSYQFEYTNLQKY